MRMRRLDIGLASVIIAAVFYGLLSEGLLLASRYIALGDVAPIVMLIGLLLSPTRIAGLALALLTARLIYRRLLTIMLGSWSIY
jgi:hypothetical protein